MATKNHLWTADDIRFVVRMWDSHTCSQIAEMLGVNEQQVYYISCQLKKAGVNILVKHKKGSINNLIKEIKEDMN